MERFRFLAISEADEARGLTTTFVTRSFRDPGTGQVIEKTIDVRTPTDAWASIVESSPSMEPAADLVEHVSLFAGDFLQTATVALEPQMFFALDENDLELLSGEGSYPAVASLVDELKRLLRSCHDGRLWLQISE